EPEKDCPFPFKSSRADKADDASSGGPLYVLDVGEDDALGALLGVAEIKFVLGHEYRVTVDVIGNARSVSGDECIELLAVVRGNPPRELEFRQFEFHRQ